MLHTLLLNSNYECIGFITERKLFKFLAKNKIEVIECWDEKVNFGVDVIIHHPAVVRLWHHVRWIPRKIRFNRTSVFRRDEYTCLYCGQALISSELTIDHIIPRSKGGISSWGNCVTSCFSCNRKKSNKHLTEAGMILLRKPIVPKLTASNEFYFLRLSTIHPAWSRYVAL